MNNLELADHLEELRSAYYTAQSWVYSAREELEEAERLESASSGPESLGPSWRGRMRMYQARADWVESLTEQARVEYEECLRSVQSLITAERADLGVSASLP